MVEEEAFESTPALQYQQSSRSTTKALSEDLYQNFLRQDLSIGDALNSQNDFLQLSAFSKTWDCSTYVSIEDGKDLFMPGEDGTIVARLVKQQALEVGQTFTLRDGAHTVGTGKVRLV